MTMESGNLNLEEKNVKTIERKYLANIVLTSIFLSGSTI